MCEQHRGPSQRPLRIRKNSLQNAEFAAARV
jgi:hypothetical protein